jgi:hypothetical protein
VGKTTLQRNLAGRRVVPYAGHKFRMKEVGGDYFVAVNKVGARSRTVDVMEHREAGDPSVMRKSPCKAKFNAIIPERGAPTTRSSSNGPTRSGIMAKVWGGLAG